MLIEHRVSYVCLAWRWRWQRAHWEIRRGNWKLCEMWNTKQHSCLLMSKTLHDIRYFHRPSVSNLVKVHTIPLPFLSIFILDIYFIYLLISAIHLECDLQSNVGRQLHQYPKMSHCIANLTFHVSFMRLMYTYIRPGCLKVVKIQRKRYF
jgi:hypothetical protein